MTSYNTVDVSHVTYGEYEYTAGSTGGGALFLSVKVGGLSPPAFESEGAQAPPAPPYISAPVLLFCVTYAQLCKLVDKIDNDFLSNIYNYWTTTAQNTLLWSVLHFFEVGLQK